MKAIIYGAGEQGRLVLDILQQTGVDVIGFLDDNIKLHGKIANGVSILVSPDISNTAGYENVGYITALDDNIAKAIKYKNG